MNVLSFESERIFASLMVSSRQEVGSNMFKASKKNNLITLNILVSFVVIGKDVVDKNSIDILELFSICII